MFSSERLKGIDVFVCVAETGSFKAAAEELGYTQAGISYLVNALEKELGLTLFLREYGGVHLTTEGREVLGLVQAINADMMKVHRDKALTPEGKRQRLDELIIEKNALLKASVLEAERAQKWRKP